MSNYTRIGSYPNTATDCDVGVIINFTLYIVISGIVLEAYCPLGNPGSPLRKDDHPSVLQDPVVKDIAEKHKVTVGQVQKTDRQTHQQSLYPALAHNIMCRVIIYSST